MFLSKKTILRLIVVFCKQIQSHVKNDNQQNIVKDFTGSIYKSLITRCIDLTRYCGIEYIH